VALAHNAIMSGGLVEIRIIQVVAMIANLESTARDMPSTL